MPSRDTNSDRDRTLRTALTRRRMLSLSSAAIATGIAGCSSGNSSTETPADIDTGTATGGSSSEGSPTETSSSGTSSTGTNSSGDSTQNAEWIDPVPAAGSESLLKNTNWNFLSNNYYTGLGIVMFDPLARTYLDGTFEKIILDEWNYDNDTRQLTLKLKDTWKWHDGMTVTGEDFYIGQEIDRLSDPSGSKFEKHELIDEFTVRSTYKEEQNPALVELNVGGFDPVRTKRDVWEQWRQELQDVTTNEERQAVQSDLVNYEITTQELKDEGLGNSTLRLEDWSTTQFSLKKFGQHPHADRLDFNTWLFPVASGAAVNQQISNDAIDVGGGTFPNELEGSAPEDLNTVYKGVGPTSWKLTLNWQNEHIQKRGVRRAIAAALPLGEIAQFFGNGGGPKKLQTGMGQSVSERWIGQDMMDNMIEYPIQADSAKAAEFLRSEGYSKSGGNWTSEDGKNLKLKFVGWSNSGWIQAEKLIVRALQNAGMQVQQTVKETSQFINTVVNSLDFDIAPFTHSTNANPLSAYNYANPYNGGRLGQDRGSVQQWAQNGLKRSKFNNRTLKPTVPKDIGSLEVNGDGRQIDIVDTYDKIATADSREKTSELTRDLAWYWNFDLPDIDMIQVQIAMWGDTSDFKFPEGDDLVYRLPTWKGRYVAMKEGKIKGRQKP